MVRTGVTQEQVDAAADALLRAGERPTIERVRALLGTGSPNTLVRLVDAWWGRLGSRLTAVEAKLALPSAPEAGEKAASGFLSAALTHATALATKGMEQEREALEQAKSRISARAEEFARDKAEASRLIAVAEEARSREETRCQDLELLIARA